MPRTCSRASLSGMTTQRRQARFSSAVIGVASLLAACGGNQPIDTPQAGPETEDVEVVTVTEYADGTVLGPDDDVAITPDEPEAADNRGGSSTDKRTESPALAPGEYEFIGTVEKQSTEEVLKGAPPPNPSDVPSDRYYVLVLDEPQEVSAAKAGPEPYSQVNEILSLGAVNSYRDDSPTWERYVGKRVRIIASQDDLSYPSDTSLPLGALALWGGGHVEEL